MTHSLFALTNFNLTTTLYPVTSVAITAVFVGTCLLRRKSLPHAGISAVQAAV